MKTKTAKITLEGLGSYLGMEKGCFIVKNEEARAEASDITARPHVVICLNAEKGFHNTACSTT